MSIRIGTHLHLPLDHPQVRELCDYYTRDNPEYVNAQRMGFSTNGIPPVVEAFTVRGDVVDFPREAVHRLHATTELVNETSRGDTADLGRAIQLRPYQVEPVARMVETLETFKAGVFQAAPGAGKTTCALEIARRLGRKTIVLVHKSFLLNQWVDRIQEFLGVQAGVVWQDRFEVNAPIVVAMMQTLNSRSYDEGFYRSFGLVISDESHRVAAPTMAGSVVQFPSTYRLGLTATPERADGLEWVVFGHLGPVSVSMSVERENPRVYIIPTPIGSVRESMFLRRGKPDFVAIVTFLTQSPARNRLIVSHTVDAVKHDRKVIVFSDRRQHLQDLATLFEQQCLAEGVEPSFGFYMGGLTEFQRQAAASKRVLFSTYSFASEGMDVPDLDTCIMASPKAQVEQVVGRIQRTVEGKPTPLVVDLIDEGLDICRGLLRKRMRLYAANGWDLHDWREAPLHKA